MRLENNMQIFLIFIQICVVILSARPSSAADSHYEACSRPRKCSHGPNISFPFYIEGLQESYCGFPGFMLHCNDHGFPVIDFAETKYVVQDIFYETRSFRVYDSATLTSNRTDCVPRIRNTTLPRPQFEYASNVKNLNLLSNCNVSWSKSLVSRQIVVCDDSRVWGLYDKDEGFGEALENCGGNLVVPVEDDGNMGVGNVVEVLRKGFEIKWTASDCSDCKESGGYCGFNNTSYVFKCFCPSRPHSRTCKPDKHSRLILATAISGTAVFLLCLLASLIFWQCKKRLKPSSFLSRNTSSISKSDIKGGTSYFGTPIFSYKELVEATNNFDSSKELGDGGFGTVYYGKLHDGRDVAVKRLYERNNRRVEQFMNEIQVLAGMRHKNLVSLYGCTSSRSRELLLVYEYIPNGTVADHLHGERANEAPLIWPIRMKIAIETASALAYLHKSDIIHRDVKTNNILLDDNFCVKIADFGLSRLFPNDVTHISTAPQGTPGYVDPSYYQCYQLTNKSDVYSFGVVLIELVSSMPAVDITRHSSEINLANLAINRIQTGTFDKLIDSSLGYNSDVEVTRMATSVAELAFRCLQVEKDLRPSMDEVVSFLKDIQSGGEIEFEMKKEGNIDVLSEPGNVHLSPETDDVILLKKKSFQSSPNAVIDGWVSSSTTRSSFNKSVGTL